MTQMPRLDHTVINVGTNMDGAEAAFTRLGFALTPRGFHSMGSINHLMMFGTDYLELIGLPEGGGHLRPLIAQAPPGINAMVLKTTSADAEFAHLEAIGMAGDAPESFTRPVTLPDGEADAAFRICVVRSDVFAAGRVFYCQHGTPELVWRPEWQSHANGAESIAEVAVVAEAFEAEAEKMARLLDVDVTVIPGGVQTALDGARISFMPPAFYALRYGDLASPLNGRDAIYGALVFRTRSLDAVRAVAAEAGVPTIDEANRVVLREPSFDSVLEFIV